MLKTKLKTLADKEELKGLIEENEKVVVCCGRMGPMCIPVYGILEIFEEKYPDTQFRNMDFDTPAFVTWEDLQKPPGQSYLNIDMNNKWT